MGPHGLAMLAIAAVFGALLGRECGIVGVGAAGALAVCAVRAGFPAAALALTAALGAVPTSPRDLGSSSGVPHSATTSTRLVRIDGIVVGPILPDRATGRLRFSLRPAGGVTLLRCRGTLGRGEGAPHPGDRIRGPALLRRGDAEPVAEIVLAAMSVQASGSPGTWPTRVRLACESALSRHVGGEAGAVAAHLVLGRGPRLADDLVDAHRATGLAHLLAVSGAHASMLAVMLAAAYAAVRGRDPWQARRFRRVSAMLLVGYGAVTGFEPPVLRALAAWCVVAFAGAHGRRPTVGATLAVPALLTALLFPQDLLSVSFALSYAAVIGLAVAGAFRRPEGPWDRVGLAVRASLFAMAATTPFTLAWFGQLSPWTLIGTPLLAPLVTVMLALGVTTCALALAAPPLAACSGSALAFLTDGYAAAVRTFAQLPGSPVPATVVPSGACLLAAVLAAVAWLCFRPTRVGFLVACTLVSVPHFVPGAGGAPAHRITLAAVGHGQAAVGHLPDGSSLVVDCGSRVDARRAVDAALDALSPRRTVDLLVISHADADHIGGAVALSRRATVRSVILPAELMGGPVANALRSRVASVSFLAPGEDIAALDGAVRVFAPRVPVGAARNDRSLWTEIHAHGLRMVLPGDADAVAIRAAIRVLAAGPVTALVLPHHGRGDPDAIDALVEHLEPRTCLASSGDTPTETRRLAALGMPVLSTAEHGDLHVHLAAPGTAAHGLVTASVPARLRADSGVATR